MPSSYLVKCTSCLKMSFSWNKTWRNYKFSWNSWTHRWTCKSLSHIAKGYANIFTSLFPLYSTCISFVFHLYFSFTQYFIESHTLLVVYQHYFYCFSIVFNIFFYVWKLTYVLTTDSWSFQFWLFVKFWIFGCLIISPLSVFFQWSFSTFFATWFWQRPAKIIHIPQWNVPQI